MSKTKKIPEKILIVGGGFAGVKAALELANNPRFVVTLLSDSDELRYYPTLYHTATGGKRANSSIPYSTIFKGKNLNVAQGRAVSLNRKIKSIATDKGQVYQYDSLVLALGVVTNYFGIDGLKEYSYSIKTQDDVARLKTHLHRQLSDEKQPDLNYVIVGAGPTGIELAGALPSYLERLIEQHGVKSRKIHIDLIEAAPRLLPRLPNETSRTVRRQLKRLGITLYLDSVVQGETAEELLVNGKPIRSHTVIWTAGVTNHPFYKDNDFVLMGRGKVAVDTYLQAEDGVFVLGDNANTPYSGLAQTALRDGAFLATNLKRRASDKNMRSYNAKQPITVIPAGPRWAAVLWGKISLHGRSGWLLREAADLIGFHDLEPWKTAGKQFLTEFATEEICPICAAASLS